MKIGLKIAFSLGAVVLSATGVPTYEDGIKALSVRAHEKGLELICDIGAEVPCALIGDPGRLRQVVTNLIGNAIKFTEQGEVTLRVEQESLSGQDVVMHFVVSDTGVGIASARQQAIFEAFTQADGSMTRKYGGTGLGLTISSRLVEGMGGRIWVESHPGLGSSFHFTAGFGLQENSRQDGGHARSDSAKFAGAGSGR